MFKHFWNLSKRFVVVLGVLTMTLIVVVSARMWSGSFEQPSTRTLELTETIHLKIPPASQSVRLWIPRLPNDKFQSVELLEVRSPWSYRIATDPDFGNELIYLEASSPKSVTIEVQAKYLITRREQRGPDKDLESVSSIFTELRGLVVIDDQVRRIARKVTRGFSDPMRRAKALYHYVLGHVDYDTTGEGWGRGDVVYACAVGKGNCTDFHSLFIALARAEGIPARFRIGYPLPEASEGRVLKPYHCWAEFHVSGKGWIPVDISEAWKHPAKADYYFGALDENRVLVSTGRDIRLFPDQKGPSLNYLVGPYVEIDGQPYHDVKVERNYKNSESS